MPPPSRKTRRRPRTTTAISKASAASASRRTRRSHTSGRSYMYTESRAMTARKMKTVQRDILEREARIITSTSPSKLARSSLSSMSPLESMDLYERIEEPEGAYLSPGRTEVFDSKLNNLSRKSTSFKSDTVEIEIRLREAMATYPDNHPHPIRTAAAFDALTKIIPHLSGFRRIMRTIALELFASIYPKEVHQIPPVNTPYFKKVSAQNVAIQELDGQLSDLRLKYDSLLDVQTASGGSITVIVNRWRRKLLATVFQSWRTVSFLGIELKNASAAAYQKAVLRKRYQSVFKAWQKWTTRELLKRERMNAMIVKEQAEDLEACQKTIKELRENLASMNEQVKFLVNENSALKTAQYDIAQENGQGKPRDPKEVHQDGQASNSEMTRVM